jgi:cell fate (sporulation/competence/biofilm development) regulator YmcA (YheA/YmcA/DUF963 family)
MAENVNLNKKVFNKNQYKKTINTSFTELGIKSTQQSIDEQPTIQEFFDMYNTLFYDIPELGETNSHEFLVKTSGEYINTEVDNELIEALQEEISQLRTDLLKTQQDLVESITTTTL